MAGQGAPASGAARLDASDLTVAIVHGQWHAEAADGLLAGARRALQEMGARVLTYPAPGAFELPVLTRAALNAGADAAVAIAVIVRGGTPHFEFVAQAATVGLTDVALLTGKPVGFGVLTTDDDAQALDRAGLPGSKEDKGREAAEAAVQAALALRAIRG